MTNDIEQFVTNYLDNHSDEFNNGTITIHDIIKQFTIQLYDTAKQRIELKDRGIAPGIGMPALLHLHDFGHMIYRVFGEWPYLVGSALHHKHPRDIDIRINVADLRFMALFPDITGWNLPGSQWAIICQAFSALGAKITGLNIDFQIQDSHSWKRHIEEPKMMLGMETGFEINQAAVDRTITTILQNRPQ